jgi:hypothetical protein
MEIQEAEDKVRNAPMGTRADTLYHCWRQLPEGTDLKPLAKAALDAGLSQGEIESILRATPKILGHP